MYVCLCNALTESQVRAAAAAGATRPKDVFRSCGCGAQCASCKRMMLALLHDRTAAPAAAAR
jgi:bacterioferritin-associated ferredoxin